MYAGMKSISAKEAFERMMAGEVVSAALIKPMTESHIPMLNEFKIYSDVVYIKLVGSGMAQGWEQYHCAINTFLKFDWFAKADEVAQKVSLTPEQYAAVSKDLAPVYELSRTVLGPHPSAFEKKG